MMQRLIKTAKTAAVLLLSGVLLAGCGESSAKTEEAMERIRDLDYEGALTLLEEAREEGENERLILRGTGIAYMGQTRYQEAIEAFRGSLALSDGFVQSIDYDLNYYLAAACTKAGEYEDAESVYNAVLAMEEQEDALFLRGMVRLRLDRFSQAKEDFDRVVALDPANVDRIIEIYQALENGGYRQAGLEYLEALLGRKDGKLTSLERGRIYFYMGQYREAAAELEEARTAGDSFDASLFLGRSYEAVGEYNYASNVYESYLAKDDTAAILHNQLGMCRLKMGNYSGALECFQAGKALGDQSVMQSLAFNEIVAYEYLGEFSRAGELMQSYLKNYPDDADALRERDFLSTR
ncbi:MAG: tetratricopeptide repeat protein [Lachnospiraceae bacterium]|nr:tetratricopeptide repeat protein [Lachnospiraceae bacterium]